MVGLTTLNQRRISVGKATIEFPFFSRRWARCGITTIGFSVPRQRWVRFDRPKRRLALGYLPTLGLNIWRIIVYILILDLKPVYKTHTHTQHNDYKCTRIKWGKRVEFRQILKKKKILFAFKRLHLPFQKWGICLICLHCATAMKWNLVRGDFIYHH